MGDISRDILQDSGRFGLIVPKKLSSIRYLENSPEIDYPESDGQPMADNTVQFHLITMITGNLEAMYRDRPDVFVAGDLLWYPVEGNNRIRRAPDAMVAFGRPKGDRGSYLQWKEDGVAPHVVFEIISPGNTSKEMYDKRLFYERYGVKEYYVFDPESGLLEGWVRDRFNHFVPVSNMSNWISPLLGIRFRVVSKNLNLYYPNGRSFLSFPELDRRFIDAEHRVEKEKYRADLAENRVVKEKYRADILETRLAEMRKKLKELGITM